MGGEHPARFPLLAHILTRRSGASHRVGRSSAIQPPSPLGISGVAEQLGGDRADDRRLHVGHRERRVVRPQSSSTTAPHSAQRPVASRWAWGTETVSGARAAAGSGMWGM